VRSGLLCAGGVTDTVAGAEATAIMALGLELLEVRPSAAALTR